MTTTSFRVRARALWLVLALPHGALIADESTAAAQAERARISAERARAERSFEAEQAACYARFAVNDCIAAASARHREVLSDLRRQEIQLNDDDRRRRTADRLRQNEERQREQRERQARPPAGPITGAPPAPAPAPMPAPSSSPETANRAPAAMDTPERPAERRGGTGSSAAGVPKAAGVPLDTDANRRRHQERLQEATERKARAAQRAAESRKDKRPLPVPP